MINNDNIQPEKEYAIKYQHYYDFDMHLPQEEIHLILEHFKAIEKPLFVRTDLEHCEKYTQNTNYYLIYINEMNSSLGKSFTIEDIPSNDETSSDATYMTLNDRNGCLWHCGQIDWLKTFGMEDIEGVNADMIVKRFDVEYQMAKKYLFEMDIIHMGSGGHAVNSESVDTIYRNLYKSLELVDTIYLRKDLEDGKIYHGIHYTSNLRPLYEKGFVFHRLSEGGEGNYVELKSLYDGRYVHADFDMIDWFETLDLRDSFDEFLINGGEESLRPENYIEHGKSLILDILIENVQSLYELVDDNMEKGEVEMAGQEINFLEYVEEDDLKKLNGRSRVFEIRNHISDNDEDKLVENSIKVIDKFVIRDDIKVGERYGGCSVVHSMEQYIGRTVELGMSDAFFKRFHVIGDENRWHWSIDMIDWRKTLKMPIESEEEIAGTIEYIIRNATSHFVFSEHFEKEMLEVGLQLILDKGYVYLRDDLELNKSYGHWECCDYIVRSMLENVGNRMEIQAQRDGFGCKFKAVGSSWESYTLDMVDFRRTFELDGKTHKEVKEFILNSFKIEGSWEQYTLDMIDFRKTFGLISESNEDIKDFIESKLRLEFPDTDKVLQLPFSTEINLEENEYPSIPPYEFILLTEVLEWADINKILTYFKDQKLPIYVRKDLGNILDKDDSLDSLFFRRCSFVDGMERYSTGRNLINTVVGRVNYGITLEKCEYNWDVDMIDWRRSLLDNYALLPFSNADVVNGLLQLANGEEWSGLFERVEIGYMSDAEKLEALSNIGIFRPITLLTPFQHMTCRYDAFMTQEMFENGNGNATQRFQNRESDTTFSLPNSDNPEMIYDYSMINWEKTLTEKEKIDIIVSRNKSK